MVIEAFQMLCPGCVSHGLPLARKVHSTLADEVVERAERFLDRCRRIESMKLQKVDAVGA